MTRATAPATAPAAPSLAPTQAETGHNGHGASAALAPALPRELAGPRATGWWGVVLLIANEAALFGALLTGYFYLRFNAPTWPLGGIKPPDLLLPGINTVLLVSSSVAVMWAEHGVTRGHQWHLRLGLAVAFVLGLAFLGVQLYEYSQETFTPQVNAYGSLFYTITGLHGLHVLAGLIMLGVVQVRAWLGHFNERRYLGVQGAAMYWHFVDVVWLFVFSIVYVSPHW
jgi:heme/copper-type cytochrome/quinol oxidase subunit 3